MLPMLFRLPASCSPALLSFGVIHSALMSCQVTRARLYQGLTRAQFLAIVVNEYLPGGWLEFLRLLKFKEELRVWVRHA